MTACEQEIVDLLPSLPSAWRLELAQMICAAKQDRNKDFCKRVKECQHITTLSNFVINGTEACVTFKDENGVLEVRCFDIEENFNEIMDLVDPGCLAPSISDWEDMSYLEKWQAIVDDHCDCCSTTTTTTEASTTTTTTT